MKKGTRELQRLLPPGFTIGYPRDEQANPAQRHRIRGVHSGHPFVLDPSGQPVIDHRGLPIRVASTPRQGALRRDLRRIAEIAEQIRNLPPEPGSAEA